MNSIDGIYFEKTRKGVKLDLTEFEGKEQTVSHPHMRNSDQYLCLIVEEEPEDKEHKYRLVYFKSYLSDPEQVARNYAKADDVYQGVLVKTSIVGYDILKDILKANYKQADDLLKSIENDEQKFLENMSDHERAI